MKKLVVFLSILCFVFVARVNGQGVGINSTGAAPDYDLDIEGANADDGSVINASNSDDSHLLRLFSGRSGDPNPFIMWKSGDPLRLGNDNGGFEEDVRITSDGDLQVNDGSISVNTTDGSNKFYIRAPGDDNHVLQYLGGTIDGPVLQGNLAVVLRTATGCCTGQLVVKNNRVGINTDNPTRGLLDVNGFYTQNSGGFAFYAYNGSGPNTGGAGGDADVSIYATNRIHASEFNAFSDARIKNIIGVSDAENDLKMLLNIQVTDYRMKDLAKDTKPFKKVIAQQVQDVYPQAVSKATDVIPDIYQVAPIHEGYVNLANNLRSGDKVQLIFEEGNKTQIKEVLSADANGFKVDASEQGNVFVYGREVKDFLLVDYEAISMLNVSATQEQQRIIDEQRKEIERLKLENAALKGQVSANSVRLEAIESLLNSQASK